LYILTEIFFSGYEEKFLDFLYLTSIISGVFVIISKNPVISVLFLIGLFLSVAGYLIILGINFIGLSYLLVYVGAVSILFLFILMLINVRISELFNNTKNSIPLAVLIGVIFIYPFYEMFYSNDFLFNINFSDPFFNNNIIMFASSKTWDSNILSYSHIASIGNIIYTNYYI
jgi:NADH-ubiquinone oxidoreductase chain 6